MSSLLPAWLHCPGLKVVQRHSGGQRVGLTFNKLLLKMHIALWVSFKELMCAVALCISGALF